MIKIKKSITEKIIFDVVLAMVVLSALLSYIGYLEFTEAIEDQYADSALRTARTAITFADVEKISEYNDEDTNGEFYLETMELVKEWQRLVDTQGVTFAYIFQPNVEKNYNEIRFVLSVMNSDADSIHFYTGHVQPTENEEYRQAYRDIYENKKEYTATFYYDKLYYVDGFVTVLLPMKNSEGEVKGILGITRPMEDMRYFRKLYLHDMFITTAIISLLIIFIYTFYLNKTVVTPIKTLSDGVREIASGDLDKKLDIKTGDEVEHLAICFNAMTSELQTYMKNLTQVTAEKERIATELNVAQNIQLSMLPHDFNFGRADFDIFATMNAAKMVGGDFYDFYLLDENHLVITIADVSGKGVPAALFMSRSKTILKNFAMMMNNPDDFAAVMTLANNQLCQDNEEMMFVTVFMGMLDLKTGKFIFVNGGHNPPIIYHAKENSCEYLSVKKNFVLGGMEDVPYKQQETILERGDLIFTYTDGVNEAMNIKNEEYTSERLLEFMNATDCRADLKTLLAAVKSDVSKHVGAAEQSDDITMLALRRN